MESIGNETRTRAEKLGRSRPSSSPELGRFSGLLAEVIGEASTRSFAQRCGLSESVLRDYLAGRSFPSLDRLAKIADASGRSLRWFLGGEECVEDVASAYSKTLGDFALVPRYDVRVAAGHGAEVEGERILGWLAFRRDWLRHEGLEASKLALVEASGDSMEPTLAAGDLLLVDLRARDPGGGGVFALRVDGGLVVKRLAMEMGGGVFVRSDNPAYPSRVLAQKEAAELQVLGRVVWACKRL